MSEMTPAPAQPAALAPVPPMVEGKPIPSPATPAPKPDAQKSEAKPDQASPEAEKPETEEAERKKRDFKSRFNEVYGKMKQNEAEAISAKREVARLYAELEKLKSTPTDNLSFEQQEEIRLRGTVKAESLDQASASAEAKLRELQRAQIDVFQTKVEAARERMPDFDQVFTDRTPVSEVATDFIVDSERGAEIAYWLGKNPTEALRLYNLPPVKQGVELARLEARLSAAPQARKVSQAPAPVPTLGGSSAPAEKTPQEMSMAEYVAWRNAKKRTG